MEARYLRNFDALTEEEFRALRAGRVLVVGCGGLGGHLIELLARLGVGSMTVVDGDVFEETNLNRQLLSTEALLGCSKAQAAADRVRAVNSQVSVHPVCQFLTPGNADSLVAGHDLVMDALDNTEARKVLSAACSAAGVPMVHGAICGWYAQISTILPGSDALQRIYPGQAVSNKTSLSFTPALCASLQVSEAVKLLTCRRGELEGRLLFVDLRAMEWQIIDLF